MTEYGYRQSRVGLFKNNPTVQQNLDLANIEIHNTLVRLVSKYLSKDTIYMIRLFRQNGLSVHEVVSEAEVEDGDTTGFTERKASSLDALWRV